MFNSVLCCFPVSINEDRAQKLQEEALKKINSISRDLYRYDGTDNKAKYLFGQLSKNRRKKSPEVDKISDRVWGELQSGNYHNARDSLEYAFSNEVAFKAFINRVAADIFYGK